MTEITHNFNILCELQLVHMSTIIITCLLPTSTYAHISVQDIVSSTISNKTVHMDVTVTNPLTGRNNATCNNQSLALLSKRGWAAEKAAAAKITKYGGLLQYRSYRYVTGYLTVTACLYLLYILPWSICCHPWHHNTSLLSSHDPCQSCRYQPT